MIKKNPLQANESKKAVRLKDLKIFAESLGIRFKKIELLELAFVHSSYQNEHSEFEEDNERLEFLGDSVLGLVVARYLYGKYPKASEGELSRLKSKLVSTTVLNSISDQLGLSAHVLLGRGEGSGSGQKKLGANLFEALIGAVYLDQGMEAAEKIILKNLIEFAENSEKLESVKDFKTLLQEVCQRKFKTLPTYRLLRESGPDHAKTFQVSVKIRDKYETEGIGKNKKFAEQDAARNMLRILGIKNG
ncbi:ribonuclease III [Leptospira fluminis]|uniref:Ribonuclease 3 n=1 Tax=Leptospira fluminis TaxID=2484979 RepID=A0A4R9GNX8_9LEPT|nr:ribonuclease III [Leptospira fluminis]TGK18657.1 ribonuclease III [Leptospira fluminis]